MSALSKSLILAGIKGQVLALDRTTGTEVWRTRLKGASFVNLLADGDIVVAATSGEVFGLDGATGSILWHNPLRRLGLGLVSLLGSGGGGGNVLAAEESRRIRARQSAAATQ
jgi:outer membrane protein assembly factor BamB